MNSHHDRLGASPVLNSAWSAFLLVASAVGSLVFACVTPFAALAAVAAMTLPLPLALATTMSVWLSNQAIGFLVLAYPVSGNSLGWGLALGLAALAALAATSFITKRVDDRSASRRWIVGLGAAFLVQQGVLFAASGILGGGEGFSATVIGDVASINVLWTLALAMTYGLVNSIWLGKSPFRARGMQST